MTAWQYIAASLRQFRRVHLSVAAGVAVSAAVITGALLVGDSMRGSLRDIALRGLGRVDAVLLAEHPFRAELAAELLANGSVARDYPAALPLLVTHGAAEFRDDDRNIRRATTLEVYGVPPEFWSLAPSQPPAEADGLRGNQIALTATVAAELGAKTGDYILLRLPLAGATPADSSLGEKEEASTSRRLEVVAVLDDRADTMARFSLRPTQQSPRNVFLPLATLQNLLELPDAANAIALAAAPDASDSARPPAAISGVEHALRPELSDFGITIENDPLGDADTPRYVRISADRLVLPPHSVAVAKRLYGGDVQPVVTYLANTIEAGDRKVPYSTVAGVDSTAALGPVLDADGAAIELTDDEVAINDWTARELDVEVGDEMTISYYEPETTHGELREAPPLVLTVRAIVPLTTGQPSRPTAAADPKFAPELPGVTDSTSIEAWELPFELVEDVRDEDEEYWEQYRTTPKAFVSFDLARRLWATRWGTESVLRIPSADGPTADTVAAELRGALDPAELGMALLPVKRQALAAASGTTPFDGLFLGFSFFLMASAVMLTALLFRLGLEQRAREVGLLLAVGASPSRVRRLLAGEGLVVAALGAAVGTAAGVGYAAIMVHGLNTWWVDATAAPFLQLHVTPRSIAIGFVAALIVALATIWWTLRRFARLAPRLLLAGDHQPPLTTKPTSRFSSKALPIACLFASTALGLLAATRLQGEAQAGAFFGGGALALVGILAAVRNKLREPTARAPQSFSLTALAVRNARRNPSRTMLSLALAATASFLIVALSAFRLAPTDRGTGGFDLIGRGDVPLHFDLNTTAGREQLRLSAAANRALETSKIVSFRVRDGEDASCLNLYQTTQPRILGAPPEIADLSSFQFSSHFPAPSPRRGGLGRGDDAGTRSTTPPHRGEGGGENSNWSLLTADLGVDANSRPVIPMVLDRNTAFYSLKLYQIGDRLTIRDAFDRPATLQIVGLLTNSILQGDVIVSEANFLLLFPDTAGRRYFLIRRGVDAPPTDELASLLETQLEDSGFDAVDARGRLGELLAVQNTYLSTFQTLGALGLLLGAVGLAVTQLRSVLERRGELALMQAAGFRRRRLAAMVLAENLVLLLGGLAIGCVAALAAVIPHAAIQQVGAPWRTLGVLLAIVAAAGTAAAWQATRTALSAPSSPHSAVNNLAGTLHVPQPGSDVEWAIHAEGTRSVPATLPLAPASSYHRINPPAPRGACRLCDLCCWSSPRSASPSSPGACTCPCSSGDKRR